MTVVLPSAPCVISQGTVIEDFTNLAAWVADAQTTAPVRHYRCLDQANKGGIVIAQPTTATAQGFLTRTGLSLNLAAMTTLRLDFCWPYCGSAVGAIGGKITMEFSSTGNFAVSKMSATTAGGQPSGLLKHGYSRMTVGLGEFVSTGGESFANTMVAMRVGLTTNNYGDGATHYTCGPVVLLDKVVMNAQQKAMVVIGIDTSLQPGFSKFLAALDAYGLRSHAFTAMIGRHDKRAFQAGQPGPHCFDFIAVQN